MIGLGFHYAREGHGRIDRSAYYRARQKDPDVSIREFVTTYEVDIEPPPCWQHLGESVWRSAPSSWLRV